MSESNKMIVFESKKIRRTCHNDESWFSVVDVANALMDSANSGVYWRKLKQRLIAEGSQVVTNCHDLKLEASDGKKYKTDFANTKEMFRIIQSIPSSKAEPFKQWLAPVGYERVQEIENHRDHMTDLELIFTMLGIKVITEIPKKELGQSVISRENYLQVEDKRKKKK